MDKLFGQLPAIIEQSAKSTLGIVALAVIALSIIAYLLFYKASSRVKLIAFLLLSLGFALLISQILKVFNSESQGKSSIAGHVVSIENAPQLLREEPIEEYLMAWLNNAKIIIDVGGIEGVVVEDYFAVRDAGKSVSGGDGNVLGKIVDYDVVLLRVVEVQPKMSICAVNTLAYQKFIDQLRGKLSTLVVKKDGTVDMEQVTPLLAMAYKGQEATLIKRDEKEAWTGIENELKRADAIETSLEERKRRYQDVKSEIDRFLLKYPQGYFAPDAIFIKGVAHARVGEKQNAIRTFELFLTRYPFHVSAQGARDWIKQIEANGVDEAIPDQRR